MAAELPKPVAQPTPPGASQLPAKPRRPRVDWRSVWPIPLAIVATAGLVTGLMTAVARAPKHDPAIPLGHAEHAYSQDRFADVLEIINDELVPYINAGQLSQEQEKAFFALRARSLHYGQERLGVSHEENHRAIIESYEQGRRRGMAVETADIGNLAECYLAVRDVDKAVELARSLESRDQARQLRLYERIIEREMKTGSTQYPRVLGLLNEMLAMPGLTIDQRAWAVSRQATIRLEAGFPQEAVTRLLREMPKFEELPREVRADLLFILGKAYANGIDDYKAVEYLDRAIPELSEFDQRRGEALVIQGRILAQNGKVEEARERFQVVREGFKESAAYALAVLGEADTAAEMADFDAALNHYAEAAGLVATLGPAAARGITLDSIGGKLMDQHKRRVLENDPQEALRFVRKAQEVYRQHGAIPSDVHLALAQANRLNAQIMLRESAGTPASEPAPRPDEVSPVTATTAKGYLLDAGQSFRDHARSVVATDYAKYMDSLMAAGDCFDQAGESQGAIEAFTTFLSDAREDYPSRPEAMFRLAQVYQSQGQYKAAARWYQGLVDKREGFGGQWADRSLVPLARCYVADPTLASGEGVRPDPADANDKPNERIAIALLGRAVAGQTGVGPDAAQMRDAQAELGELHYRRGEFRQAIELFNRLVDTYQDQTPRLSAVLYKRADGHRQLAIAIDSTFDQRPLSERQELAEARRSHLLDARRGYQEAATAITKRGSRATRAEKLYQRNAAFYTADCAYLLGEWEQAVQEYARAREQHAGDPAALVAMVQTVSALIRLERWDDAQNANERAKGLLATIPDETWSNPQLMLPMERRHWESWLAARMELESSARRSASVPTP